MDDITQASFNRAQRVYDAMEQPDDDTYGDDRDLMYDDGDEADLKRDLDLD